MEINLSKQIGLLFVSLTVAASSVAQVGTPRHWEQQPGISIKAPKDSIFVIEFVFLRAVSFSYYEIQLPNGAGGLLKLESYSNGNFDLAKKVKFVLMPGETLGIQPWSAPRPSFGGVYASGYAQKAD